MVPIVGNLYGFPYFYPLPEATMASDLQITIDGLRRIVQALRQSAAHSEQSSNVTGAQALVLRHIAARDGLSVNELAALTFTHQSTVSEVISRLEGRGLVERVRAADDGRRRALHLTFEGQTAVRKTSVTAQETLMRTLQTMPPTTVAKLAQGLAALVDAAGLAHAQPVMFFEVIRDQKETRE
jgi:DNA-binding MarR family transcriptional regulator